MKKNKKFLVLVAGKDQLSWSIFDAHAKMSDQITVAGKQDALQLLYNFLHKKKIKLTAFDGIGLIVLPAGLTSVKIWCTIINTLGWTLGKPVAAIFYPSQNQESVQTRLLAKLAGQSRFAAIKPVYRYRPDIVVSKVSQKYKIVK